MSSYVSGSIRQRIAEISRFRCGYCLTSQLIVGPLLEIDHIIPVSRGGTSDEGNLILACPMCNGYKADQQDAIDPESLARVTLFHPHTDRWPDHFEWVEDGTVIRGLTPTGRATVAALRMNHPDVVTARRLWVFAGWHPPAH